MGDRHKYSHNRNVFFKNARWHMTMNNFPMFSIGPVGGLHGWYLTLRNEVRNDGTYFGPCIYTNTNRSNKCRYYFSIMKNDGSSKFLGESSEFFDRDYGPSVKIPVSEWLNEKNGYLTDGGIRIEYGFQIEGFWYCKKDWTFNFLDRVFDCEKKKNMITFHKVAFSEEKNFLYCHKQLLAHHSSYFNPNLEGNFLVTRDINNIQFIYFLLISHGVRNRVNMKMFDYPLFQAQKYKLSNVVKLIDRELVLGTPDIRCIYPDKLKLTVDEAIEYDLQYYLAKLLREQRSLKRLAKKLKNVDLETVSGESMKKLVRFFLYQ
uniref:BTB domain-containing protein n=1 Tax=Caenorhabditis tropicalis TaxID=1561998 RepID=A0A1I7UKU9_9PELO